MKLLKSLVAAALATAAWAVQADITVGVTVSATGPAASLGIPEKNTIDLMPKQIGKYKVNYVVLETHRTPRPPSPTPASSSPSTRWM